MNAFATAKLVKRYLNIIVFLGVLIRNEIKYVDTRPGSVEDCFRVGNSK